MKADDDSFVNIPSLFRKLTKPWKEGGLDIWRDFPQMIPNEPDFNNGEWSPEVRETIIQKGALSVNMLYGGCQSAGLVVKPFEDSRHKWYDPDWRFHFGRCSTCVQPEYAPYMTGGGGYFMTGNLAHAISTMHRKVGLARMRMEDTTVGVYMAPFKATRISMCKQIASWPDEWGHDQYTLRDKLTDPLGTVKRDWCSGWLSMVHKMGTSQFETLAEWTRTCSEIGPENDTENVAINAIPLIRTKRLSYAKHWDQHNRRWLEPTDVADIEAENA